MVRARRVVPLVSAVLALFTAIGCSSSSDGDGSSAAAITTFDPTHFSLRAGVEHQKLDAPCNGTTERECYLQTADYNNAYWLAYASRAVYKETVDSEDPNRIFGFRDALQQVGVYDPKGLAVFDYSSSGAHAAYFEVDDVAVLVFRGTRMDLPANFITDLSVRKTADGIHGGFSSAVNDIWPPVAPDGTLEPKIVPNDDWHGTGIPVRGDLLPYIVSRFAAHPPKAFYITGHSLGAAMATVTLHHLLLADAGGVPALPKNTALYAFGAPRVGSPAFAEKLFADARTHKVPFYRIVHRIDTVCGIPFVDMGFQHVGAPAQPTDTEDGLDSLIHVVDGLTPGDQPKTSLGVKDPDPAPQSATGIGDHDMGFYVDLLNAIATEGNGTH